MRREVGEEDDSTFTGSKVREEDASLALDVSKKEEGRRRREDDYSNHGDVSLMWELERGV